MGLTFDWTNYVDLARSLANVDETMRPGVVEARQRSSVSRAYYGAFARARRWLQESGEGGLPPGGSVHRFVAGRFSSRAEPWYREIGDQLARLRVMRNAADYQDEVPRLSETLRETLIRAESVLRLLKAGPPAEV